MIEYQCTHTCTHRRRYFERGQRVKPDDLGMSWISQPDDLDQTVLQRYFRPIIRRPVEAVASDGDGDQEQPPPPADDLPATDEPPTDDEPPPADDLPAIEDLVDDRSLPTLEERGITTAEQLRQAIITNSADINGVPYFTEPARERAAERLGLKG